MTKPSREAPELGRTRLPSPGATHQWNWARGFRGTRTTTGNPLNVDEGSTAARGIDRNVVKVVSAHPASTGDEERMERSASDLTARGHVDCLSRSGRRTAFSLHIAAIEQMARISTSQPQSTSAAA